MFLRNPKILLISILACAAFASFGLGWGSSTPLSLDDCSAPSHSQPACSACRALERSGLELAPGSAARNAFLQEWRSGQFCSAPLAPSRPTQGCCD